MVRFVTALAVAGCLLLAGCASSQSATSTSSAARSASDGNGDNGLEPYDEVITDAAKSDSGLFVVHRVDNTYYYEIPDSLMGKDMLLVSRLAKVPQDLGPYVPAGRKVGERVFRWERVDNRVVLQPVSYTAVAADSLPIAQSVSINNFEPIIGAFDVKAINEDSSTAVIDVTKLFTSDVAALNGFSNSDRERLGMRGLDSERSYVNYMRSYPENVEVRHTLTFTSSETNTNSLSVELNQSMVLLPETPMRPRLADDRLGYFSVEQVDYGSDQQKAAERALIQRWRLEPSDPEAYARGELVEPVKPIVYYIDPATPEKWRPYFKKGIEDWNVAFEAAGFKNAIQAKEAPAPEEDPEWSAEDVRYSTARYVASTTRNAQGPRVADPRSGEIIESDIIWYHNHLRSYRNRLIIETGAANSQARSLTIPDELIGETMRQVIAHEVGHAIGLPHNMIASSSFPVDSLRSPTFTAQYGVAPSIMDYARQNYIAQPGDGVERFVRKIGPYDLYAVEWGYRVFPETTSPEDEQPILDEMIRTKADDPRYRYVPQRGGWPVDPRAQTEDLGADPVQASTYAVQNLRRVVPELRGWATRPSENYDDLEEIYGELLGMYERYMGHVVSVVGGVHMDLKTSRQDGPVYERVPRAGQEEAVAFLHANLFETPTWLLDPDILRRIEHAGAIERMRDMQVDILDGLLHPERMQRLVEAEAFSEEEAYPLLAFMGDVQSGVWSELESGRPTIDTYRRHLQRGYLERMEYLLTEEVEAPPAAYRQFILYTPVDVSQSDIRPFVRGALTELQRDARAAARRAGDTATRYHLEDVDARIDTILSDEDE